MINKNLFAVVLTVVGFVLMAQPKTARIYTTAKETGQRLELSGETSFYDAKQPVENAISVFVNPNKKFQTHLGIGGAITDASAEVFAKLTPANQQRLLEAYYDTEKGIAYNIVRTNIHSCDFSSGSYTYVSNDDKSLKTFDISHDLEYRIPLIKKAQAKIGEDFMFYASPWSPPPFMKTNNHMLKGGSLKPEYYQSWALYYTKFIKAYEKLGMPIWGITVQNEPMATQTWESCIYTAEQERDFVKTALGPTMAREGLGDKKIVVWDHNRDLISHRAMTIFEDSEAAKYIWGIGFHWYETWTGGLPLFDNLNNVKEAFPDMNLIFTEGCAERFDPEKYQFWPNAERYGNSIINDFNAGTAAWTDWNILLDERGGPNHVGNFCFAPVHADTRTGDLIFTPSYYYLGHFSRFIRPQAVRVSTAVSRSTLLSTSYENTDGTTATVVMNQTDNDIEYQLYVMDRAVKLTIPAHGIQTVVY